MRCPSNRGRLTNTIVAPTHHTLVRWNGYQTADPHGHVLGTDTVRIPFAADSASPTYTKFSVPSSVMWVQLYDASSGSPIDNASAYRGASSGCSQIRVRTAVGLGASGSVTPASDSVYAGTTVSYSFSPTAGISSVRVRRNGVVVASSGSFTVDTETTLTAVGDSAETLLPEVGPLINQARALLTSTTPVADASALMSTMLAQVAAVDSVRADQILDQFAGNAYTLFDFPALRLLDSALAGASLPITIPPRRPSLREVSFPSEPTAHMFVNGIFTTGRQFAEDVKAIGVVLTTAAPSLIAPGDTVAAFYNPTLTFGTVGLGFDACGITLFFAKSWRDRWNAFTEYCIPIYGRLLDTIDPVEAISQIFRNFFTFVNAGLKCPVSAG